MSTSATLPCTPSSASAHAHSSEPTDGDGSVLQAVTAAGGRGARPLVLALSNPNSKAECSFEDALHWSRGRAVFASGSPWPAVTARPQASFASITAYSSTSSSSSGVNYASSSESSSSSSVLRPAQANNCLVFPGLGLGAVTSGAAAVTDEMLLAAAQAVAGEKCFQRYKLCPTCVFNLDSTSINSWDITW
jgi:malate dehydrogenase (oxaloacetate-decarboxylating)(NADP+)